MERGAVEFPFFACPFPDSPVPLPCSKQSAMAARNETAKATIYLDGKQAEAALDGLKRKASDLRDAIREAQKAGDQVKMDRMQKELRNVESVQKSLRKETYDYQAVLRNLNGASLNDLRKALKTLEGQMNRMSRTDPGYARMQSEARALRSEINSVNNSLRQQQSFFSRTADGVNKYMGVISAGIAAAAGASMAVRSAIQGFNDYQERVAALSSLTGLEGDELQYLSQQAKELATSTMEGGVLVTNGSQAIIDAFTKVGSARPELLKDKEALVEVTKNAMILSSASKEDLQPSIEALTMVMNQYNTSATEARRIVNALAAGSKEGAGEIPYLTTAFEKAGTVAADAGLTIETLVATIETLAPRMTAPEIAGRSLKGVLLDLQAGADDTNPAIVGMATALENLKKKNLDITQLLKIFGNENITTAKILINNIEELKNYEAAVTGTNVALEQGAVNTDTNNARLAQAKERFKQLSMELGEKLGPAYSSIISKSSLMLKSISGVVDFLIKYGRAITSTIAAIVGYTIAVKVAANWTRIQAGYTVAATTAEKLYAVAKGVLTGQITLATVAQRAWNVAVKANPIGLLIGLLTGAVAWLISFDKKTGRVSAALHQAGQGILQIRDYFIDLYNSSTPLRGAIQFLVATITTGFMAAKTVVQSFWEQLKGGAKMIKAVLSFDLKGIREAFSEMSSNLRSSVTQNAQKVAQTWKNAWDETLDGKIIPKISDPEIPEKTAQQGSTATVPIGSSPSTTTNANTTGGSKETITPAQAREYQQKLEKLLEMTQKEQQERFREYYAGLGKKSFEDFLEGFIAAVENKRKETSELIKKFELPEEEEKKDPAAAYAIEKYAETERGKLNLLHARLKAGKISEQQYQDEVTRIYRDAAQKRAQIQEQEMERGRQLTALAGSFVQSLMDYELEQAGENEEEKARIRKKYAAVQFGVTAGQIIVDTAASIMKALAEMGPIAGPIAAALMAATGAVQLDIARTQIGRLESDKGYSDGGYTKQGEKHEPAGIVHAGEWVAPMEMLRSPVTAPVIAWLEEQRKAGSFASLNVGQIKGQLTKSFASGGFTTSEQATQWNPFSSQEKESTDPRQVQAIEGLQRAVEKLMKWQPRVYTEDIRKGLDNLSDIEKRRGM